MKVLTCFLGAATAMAVLSTAASAEVDKMTLQMAHIYNPGNLWYEVSDRFTKAVTERTDGNVTFNIAAGGSTGTWQEAIEQLQIGVNDLTIQSVGTLDRYHPLPGLEAFPYLIRDLSHYKSVYYGPVGKELFAQIEEETGFRIIGAGYRGARHLTANRAIRTLDDLKGLKLRVPPLKMYRRTWELASASPVPLPAVEMFTALQQGVIDGQENPLEVIANRRLDEVQGYVVQTAHVTGAMTFIFDSARFRSFSKEMQRILIEEGEATMLWATEQMVTREGMLRSELEARGMEFIEPDLADFRDAVGPIADEFPALKPWVQRISEIE